MNGKHRGGTRYNRLRKPPTRSVASLQHPED